MNVWMKVSKDEYELPLAVADTATELADMCGTKSKTIISTASSYRTGRYKKPSYIKVEVEDGE